MRLTLSVPNATSLNVSLKRLSSYLQKPRRCHSYCYAIISVSRFSCDSSSSSLSSSCRKLPIKKDHKHWREQFFVVLRRKQRTALSRRETGRKNEKARQCKQVDRPTDRPTSGFTCRLRERGEEKNLIPRSRTHRVQVQDEE